MKGGRSSEGRTSKLSPKFLLDRRTQEAKKPAEKTGAEVKSRARRRAGQNENAALLLRLFTSILSSCFSARTGKRIFRLLALQFLRRGLRGLCRASHSELKRVERRERWRETIRCIGAVEAPPSRRARFIWEVGLGKSSAAVPAGVALVLFFFFFFVFLLKKNQN